jgi:SAM-dependent methyltransferase
MKRTLLQAVSNVGHVSATGNTILAKGGVRALSKWAYLHVYEQIRSHLSGISASCVGDEVDHGEFKRYQPLPYASIDLILSAAQLRTPGRVVLDYGCGMGRVLAEAARYPCARVVGVEYNETLVMQARKNLDTIRHSLCCKCVDVILCDATEYVVPDDVNVIIMNNPFRGTLLRQVALRIRESLHRCPRRLKLFHVTNDDAPCFGKEMSNTSPLRERTLGVYSGMVLREYELSSTT